MYVSHQNLVEIRRALQDALKTARPSSYILVSTLNEQNFDIVDGQDQFLLIQFVNCPSRIRSKFTKLVYKHTSDIHAVMWVPPIRDTYTDTVECICKDSVLFTIRNIYFNG